MNKKLTIYNYNEEPVKITINNFEKVSSVVCKVISGDEILIVNYEDGKEEIFDSYPNGRLHGYDDGWVYIPLTMIDDISNIPNSYDMLEHFGDRDAKLRVGIESISDLIDLFESAE